MDVWTWRGVAAWCQCDVEGACVLVGVDADVNGVVPVEVDDLMTSIKKWNPRLQFGRTSGEVGREVDDVDEVDVLNKACVDVEVAVAVDYGVEVCVGIGGDESGEESGSVVVDVDVESDEVDVDSFTIVHVDVDGVVRVDVIGRRMVAMHGVEDRVCVNETCVRRTMRMVTNVYLQRGVNVSWKVHVCLWL